MDGRSLVGRRLDLEFPGYRRLLRADAAHRVHIHGPRLRAEVFSAPTRTVRTEEDGTEHEVAVLTLGADGGLSATPGTSEGGHPPPSG